MAEPAPDPYATASHVPADTGVRYRILRPHAMGGLGEVFVAFDTELHREVALKEIKPQHAGDQESRGRFIIEAEVTGGLEHPGIVPVYGLGTYTDGRPFYAMRFIRGDNLKEAIARYHKLSEDSSGPEARNLEFRRLLRRFIDVCNAIAYAHSRGVLHRDLKPSNIMLGKFGETLVVDWGLAKAGVKEPPKPEGESRGPGDSATLALDETPLKPASGSDYAHTMAGTAIGTPAYMSPEQAAGRLDLVGPAGDIYGLGATLYTLLTNRAPVEGENTPEILRKVQAGDLDWDCQGRLKRAPQALVAICKKAMAMRAGDRYATPLALAEDIEHWLADEPVGAYREPWLRRLARWRRRHNTLVTAAALVLLTLVAGGIASFGIVERQMSQARVLGQVDALRDAAPGAVPSLLAELRRRDVAPLARTRLRERWHDSSLTDRQRLRLGLALAGDAEVRRRLLDLAQKADDPQEILLVRDALAPFGEDLKSDLWKRTRDPAAARLERLRLWVILATIDQEALDWDQAAEQAVAELFDANPLHLGIWQQALVPVRRKLAPVLAKAHRNAAPERKQLAAVLLADYVADQTPLLADLLMDADVKQYAVLFPKLQADAVPLFLAELDKKPQPAKPGKEVLREQGTIAADDAKITPSGGQAMPAKSFEVAFQAGAAYRITMTSKDIDSFIVLHNGAGKELGFDDDSGGGLDSLLEFTPAKTEIYKVYAASLPNKDRQVAGAFVLTITETSPSGPKENLASRQANAAVALLRLGRAAKVWALLKHSPDPTVRSYVVHRLGPQGLEMGVLLNRFEEEKDLSTRRALLLSLGAFPSHTSQSHRGQLLPKLLDLYRTDSDAGLHAAAAWLLTHWGHKHELLSIDHKLATTEPPIKNQKLKTKNPTWWLNSQGQTMIALPGPIEFQMGASASDPDRYADEVQHSRRINRSFALAAHPVTVEQFLRFRKNHNYLKKYAPTADCPVHGVNWYEAAGYCNWLSEQEKIPKDQWCYETNAAGQVVKLKENYLTLTGYRLPTEAEMEYACRAGALTSRYYGAQEDLLAHYAWYLKNADDRSWPVGMTKPNDFGFFDMHGNLWNWCQETFKPYPKALPEKAIDDIEDGVTITPTDSRVLRGGSFYNLPGDVRSSYRYGNVPATRDLTVGFRPSRTLVLEFFSSLPLYTGDVGGK